MHNYFSCNFLPYFITSRIDPDLRQIACCLGLKYGSGEDYDKLWNMFLNENVINVKDIMMDSLACSRNQEKINLLVNKVYACIIYVF